MTEANIPDQSSVDAFAKDFDLYRLIIEENRHLHQVWIDNFRIILTINSILLTGTFALLTINSKAWFFAWLLRFISFIGIIVTLVGVQILRRTKAITSLRNEEIRYLETTFRSGMHVFPFEEGAFVLGILNNDHSKNMQSPPFQVKQMKCNPFSALKGYYFIGGSFIIAYIFIFVLSFYIHSTC